MRLDKWVAGAGLTRKQARKAISDGRARVDGEVRTDGAYAVPEGARVELDGARISPDASAHIMMNKPAGVLTATRDASQQTLTDLLPESERARVFPVGRLDKDVTGLILFTSDGQLAHRLISPRRNIEKVYTARVRGRLDEDCARAFEAGIELSDFKAKPAALAILTTADDFSTCEVRVTEGKYHQVKRMLSAVGHEVITLKRRAFAGIELDEKLSAGEWRRLTQAEISHLYRVTELKAHE